MLALEFDVVGQLREAGVKGAFERFHREVLALRILAMLERRILIVELLRKIVAEVSVHHFERAGVERGKTGGGDLAQRLCQLLALLTINALPRGAILSLISGE